MRVLKRTGTYEEVSFDKVLNRIRNLSKDLKVDIFDVSQKVCGRIYDNVKTSELDELAAHICSSMMLDHPDYGVLASRIIISNHQKNTSPSFSETIQILYNNVDIDGLPNPLISPELYNVVQRNKEKLNMYLDYNRDFNFDYFGFKTLERSYLLRVNGRIIERPQHMFMRVALGIHGEDVKDALQTYDLMSQKYFTHATPTLFNAGTPRAQCSSCFLVSSNSDSIDGIFDTVKDCALISKYSGGIGVHISDIRGRGSRIRGTNGTSTGIVPMLRVYNNTARYVNQSGKRNGSIAIYLEPWHADVEAFLELRKNHGNEEDRTRDLFLALWIPDLFMHRVKAGGTWSLMCPDQCKGLNECYGDEFVALYEKYEAEGKYTKQVNAQELWFKILESQIETGTPYLLYKDAANKKSNQQNLGTIKSSNLCSEIIEYSSPEECAVCLTGDTEIITDQGIRQIKDCDGVNVLSPFDSDTTLKPVQTYVKASLIDNGEKDVYQIDVVGSKSVKATANHMFLIRDTNNATYVWKKVSDMDVNDCIVTPNPNEWCSVKSITYVGKERVYDLNVPGTHNFVANGLVTHNCNLASICLPSYVDPSTKTYDFQKLHEIAKVITKNINKIIDINYYPLKKAEVSNLKHRPIGIGVQGLADTYAILKMAFDSEEAATLNRHIFETIYHGALEASMEIAKKRHEYAKEFINNPDKERQTELGAYLKHNEFDPAYESKYPGAYWSFDGSPASQGRLQFDLWNYKQDNSRYDWTALKEDIKTYGLRNSLFLAPMPTASTSQIMGFNESFEAFTSNMYKRKTLAGEFIILNKYLLNDLIESGIWNNALRDKLMLCDGSIQDIPEIPESIKQLYKTAWEMKQKVIIDQAADRGVYVCQSQSMNLYMEDPDYQKLTSMHFYAWNKGLKTGVYYLRTKPKAQSQKFTIDPKASAATAAAKKKTVVCNAEDGVCLVCSA